MHQQHHHESVKLEDQEPLSTKEKLSKLLEYWIRHNEEHARTYLEWSKRAGEEDLKTVASLLDEIVDMTIAVNQKFKEVLRTLVPK